MEDRESDPWERDWRGDLKYRPPGGPERDSASLAKRRWRVALQMVPLALLGAYWAFDWWQDRNVISPEPPIPDDAAEFVHVVDTRGHCEGPGPRVCFVPIGPATVPSAEEAAARFAAAPYSVQTDVLPSFDLPTAAIDRHRDQVASLPVMRAIVEAFPSLAADPDITIIAITRFDLTTSANASWNFAFGTTDGHRLGLVSTYRMNDRNFGKTENQTRTRERAGKLLAKYVGILHFGLHESEDPDSVLYGHILGLSSLDAIERQDLSPEELAQAGRTTALLRR